MNILALVGVVFALAGTVFGILEAVVKEFVEVFLPLDSSSDPELSCRIGNLGVFTSTYDPTCLSQTVLDESHLPQETFTSPTTEFKLLFPAQQNFIKDILPINSDLINQFGAVGGLPQPTIDALQNLLTAATPDFTNCADYMSSFQAGQLALFSTFDPILTGALAGLAVTPVMDELTDFLRPALQSIRVSPLVGNNSIAGVVVQGVLALAGLQANCGLELTTTLDSTGVACAQGVITGTAAFLSTNFTTTGGLLNNLAPLVSTSCGNLAGCMIFGIKFDVTSSLFAAIDSGSLCDFIPGGCTNIVQLSSKISGILSELKAIDDAFDALDTAVGGVFSLITVTAAYFSTDLIGLGDEALLVELNTTIPGALTLDFYPPSFATTDYQACQIQSLAADLLSIQLGSRLSGVPNVLAGDNCTFDDFFTAASALLAATDPTNAFAGLLGDLQFLYEQCALVETDPGNCKLFFPSFFIYADYSGGLDLSQFQGTGDAVFQEAVSACEDDNTDASKMSTAQILVPIAIVCIGLSVVAGAIAAFTGHKVAIIAACVLSLAGGVLNLAALLDVKSAPVYQLVGQPPQVLQPLYKAGITQVYGLIFIACGVIASILFGVSLLPCLQKEGGESKEIKVVAE